MIFCRRSNINENRVTHCKKVFEIKIKSIPLVIFLLFILSLQLPKVIILNGLSSAELEKVISPYLPNIIKCNPVIRYYWA